jgi:hypothetical protein
MIVALAVIVIVGIVVWEEWPRDPIPDHLQSCCPSCLRPMTCYGRSSGLLFHGMCETCARLHD